MTHERESIWQVLLNRALAIIDSARAAGMPDDWSLGGGTVLMLKYRHRFSKDIDIFIPDEQWLGFLTPRLNDQAEESMTDYVEQRGSLKIYYPEGEVDFVAATTLTPEPFEEQLISGRLVKLERPAEVVGKKIKYRAADFKARDLYDLALVLEKEPSAFEVLRPLLLENRALLLDRISSHDAALREDFAQIDTLEYQPSYDHCLNLVNRACDI